MKLLAVNASLCLFCPRSDMAAGPNAVFPPNDHAPAGPSALAAKGCQVWAGSLLQDIAVQVLARKQLDRIIVSLIIRLLQPGKCFAPTGWELKEKLMNLTAVDWAIIVVCFTVITAGGIFVRKYMKSVNRTTPAWGRRGAAIQALPPALGERQAGTWR
jgi:hypothetical protein